MAMYTNHVPFTLQLEQQGRRVVETVLFARQEGDITEDTCIVIRENIDVHVLFQSENETCRLYVEGLDWTINKGEMEDDNQSYILPSAKKRLLFSHDQFPLIPGDYCIRVVCGVSYYTMLRVLPKQITTGQLQIMKEEIESFLKGLAYEMVQSPSLQLSHSYITNCSILDVHMKQVLSALNDLVTHVNYSVKKDYALVPISKVRTMDAKTILYQLTYPKRSQERKVPITMCEYNLPENRYLKKMIIFLHRELLQTKRMGEGYLEAMQSSEEMKEEIQYLTTSLYGINRLLQLLYMIQTTAWFSEIEECTTSILPHCLHSDARYRAVFQLYQKWKKNQDSLMQDTLRWKRTDKLYEIWGFIQFLQILTKTMCYQPVDGWLYSEGRERQGGLQTLEGNTRIVLCKDAITIHLFYEGEIPLDAADTSHDHPLYTESTSNRPDMRMDIYLNTTYMGSLLFDFKYRPLHHIWDVTRVKHKTITMRKLSQYVLSCKSNYLFGIREARYVRPVHEVWAIHPNVYKEYPASKKLENHDLRIVQLSPTYNSEHIAENLTMAITELISKQRILSVLTV